MKFVTFLGKNEWIPQGKEWVSLSRVGLRVQGSARVGALVGAPQGLGEVELSLEPSWSSGSRFVTRLHIFEPQRKFPDHSQLRL